MNYEELYKELLKENNELKQKLEHKYNERNAGRKANDEKQQKQLQEFSALLNNGSSKKEILKTMHISNSTYYRYLKRLED